MMHNDTIVLYREGEQWVAHSLRMDQVGIGPRLVDALAGVFRAKDAVIEEAIKDPTLAVGREAPAEVQHRINVSKPLPKEIVEVAHRMVYGEWPDYIDPDFEPREDVSSFTAEMTC